MPWPARPRGEGVACGRETREETFACGGAVAQQFLAALGIREAVSAAEGKVALLGSQYLHGQDFAPRCRQLPRQCHAGVSKQSLSTSTRRRDRRVRPRRAGRTARARCRRPAIRAGAAGSGCAGAGRPPPEPSSRRRRRPRRRRSGRPGAARARSRRRRCRFAASSRDQPGRAASPCAIDAVASTTARPRADCRARPRARSIGPTAHAASSRPGADRRPARRRGTARTRGPAPRLRLWCAPKPVAVGRPAGQQAQVAQPGPDGRRNELGNARRHGAIRRRGTARCRASPRPRRRRSSVRLPRRRSAAGDAA